MAIAGNILPKGFIIDGKYKVILFIKRGIYGESYRVKGSDGNIYFLKLFNYAKINPSAFDEKNNLLEIEFIKRIKHTNIVSYIDSGEIIFDYKRFGYLVLKFIAGETIEERITREPFSNYYDIKQIIIDVLSGLDYLHSLPDPIIHNGISPQNIMLDLSFENLKAIIIGFGASRSFHQSTKAYSKESLNLNYIAPECFNNLYSPQSDIYSVGVVMYQLIFRLPPWISHLSRSNLDLPENREFIFNERRKPLIFPTTEISLIGYDESVNLILKKALSFDIDTRFKTASEFISALNGEIEVEDIDKLKRVKTSDPNVKKIQSKKSKGKGFDAIAGMKELKEQLRIDVIDALRKPEEYSRYGLTIPNGILLYGPPGCGKTFFAKCLAEEIGFEFMFLTPASLKSKYVNATQENIARLFKEAENKAPIVIFIDEINELLPNREKDNIHEMSISAVNEFLAQMDRTAEKGILIIGATNFPHNLDPAALRSGRLEKKFYIGPPDFEARKKLFEMYLKNRPLEFGIDYARLAELTENYVSADIEYLVNEASRLALKNKSRITMEILELVIKNNKPSISVMELKKYEEIKAKMEGDEKQIKNVKSKMGFKID